MDTASPATGFGPGTAIAGLVGRLGAVLAQVIVLVELTFLGGRERLDRAGVAPVRALWTAAA